MSCAESNKQGAECLEKVLLLSVEWPWLRVVYARAEGFVHTLHIAVGLLVPSRPVAIKFMLM